ncbi:hypothetical protein MATL_G00068330 [Megalops atlanticus]|uniref:DUF4806 domain-containing protein n=1 Tax=Megalops atlanticus TaxID=7932 RepID=A0A9D3QBX9_MEGAT|nr:hypothetical protein MATL_G00068330 [Megalops atlanticus]
MLLPYKDRIEDQLNSTKVSGQVDFDMFLVVEFTVSIVPESWFEDGITKWPNYKNDERINRAVQKREEPGEDWKQYDVRVLARDGDYLKAREKLKNSLTCNTTELLTDAEEEVVRKRKIKPRVIFGDTDSDNIASNEACQTSTRPQLDLRHTESFTAAQPPPLTISGMPSSPLRHIPFSCDSELRHSEQSRCTTPAPPYVTPVSHMSYVRQVSWTLRSNGHQDHFFNPRFRLGKTGSGSIPCSARIGTETPVAEMPHNISLPLDAMSEVEEFEEWLKDSRNSRAKQNMISVLGAVGGQHKKVTWNILSRLFSNEVAKQINWKGVNRKKCFKEMLTRGLLIRAVRKNQSAASAADSDVDSYAIRWFNLACDRGGGRKDRERAKEAS